MKIKGISVQGGVDCSLIKMCRMIDSMEFDPRWGDFLECLKFLGFCDFVIFPSRRKICKERTHIQINKKKAGFEVN